MNGGNHKGLIIELKAGTPVTTDLTHGQHTLYRRLGKLLQFFGNRFQFLLVVLIKNQGTGITVRHKKGRCFS